MLRAHSDGWLLAQCDAPCADEHGQGGEPVGPGVQPVGDLPAAHVHADRPEVEILPPMRYPAA
jgi:hypothetical protein